MKPKAKPKITVPHFLTLDYPLAKVAEGKLDKLEFKRRIKVGDLRHINSEALDETELVFYLVVNLTELSPETIEELDAEDWQQAQNVVLQMLGKSVDLDEA
jgi:hypothetical protein